MKLKFAKPIKHKRIGIKISALDKLFSTYIRTRDNWACVRCLKRFKPPTNVLQCSHFFGRTMKSVRFEPDNCDSLCYGCHRYWEKEDREGYRTFKVKQLGQSRFDLLTLLAHQPGAPDYKLLTIGYKKLLYGTQPK
jgi:hypothetical protein